MDSSPDRVLSYYLIGFFDVLGQSNELRRLKKLPVTDAEQAEVLTILTKTAGFVMPLRQSFRHFFETIQLQTPFSLSLLPAIHDQVVSATQADVKLRGFSDSIVVTVSLLENGVPTTPLNGVHRSFVAAAGMWLLSLSLDHPLRGGIDVGLGIDVGDGEVYGPVIDSAYRLESEIAGGPRIVGGETCIDYLKQSCSSPRQDATAILVATIAQQCLSMLRQDTDGVTVLDVLGDDMLDLDRTTRQFRDEPLADRVRPAHDAVRRQLSNAKSLKNKKLIRRYRRLLAYFDERAPLWDS